MSHRSACRAFLDRLSRDLAEPALSVEGFEAETDRRRGAGVFARVMRTMELLRERGVLFGISVTYASDNAEAVMADEFIQSMMARGALFAWPASSTRLERTETFTASPMAPTRL